MDCCKCDKYEELKGVFRCAAKPIDDLPLDCLMKHISWRLNFLVDMMAQFTTVYSQMQQKVNKLIDKEIKDLEDDDSWRGGDKP